MNKNEDLKNKMKKKIVFISKNGFEKMNLSRLEKKK